MTSPVPTEITSSISLDNILDRKRKRGDENLEVPRLTRGALNEPSLEEKLRDPQTIHAEGQKIYQALTEAIDSTGRYYSTDFMSLPSREIFPDYYELIKKPVAFEDVKGRMDRNEYRSLRHLIEDFKQIFINAKRYNMNGSQIFADAKELHRQLKLYWGNLTGEDSKEDEDDDDYFDGKPAKKKHKKDKGDKGPSLKAYLGGKVKELINLADSNGRRYSQFFLELPSRQDYPDYYDAIQNPIAFDLIQNKIKTKDYSSVQHFAQDVQTMFANAKWYNEESSRVYKDCVAMERHFNEIMKEKPPNFGSKSNASGPSTNIQPRISIRLNANQTQATQSPSTANQEKLTLKFGLQTPSTSGPPDTGSALGVPSPADQKPDIMSNRQAETAAVPTDLQPSMTRRSSRGNTADIASQNFASPVTQAPSNVGSVAMSKQASSEYATPINYRKVPKVVAAFGQPDPYIPYFHIICHPEMQRHRSVFSNSMIRQHAFSLPPNTHSIDVVASLSHMPLADRMLAEEDEEVIDNTNNDENDEHASTLRSGRVSRPKKALSPSRAEEVPSKIRVTYRLASRPPGLEMHQLPINSVTDGINVIAKFQFKPTLFGNSVFEVFAKVPGGEQVYRLFINRT